MFDLQLISRMKKEGGGRRETNWAPPWVALIGHNSLLLFSLLYPQKKNNMNINYVTISICIKISILTFPCYQNLHIFQYLLSISMINYISDVEITHGSFLKASCHIVITITILLTTIRTIAPSVTCKCTVKLSNLEQ